MAAVRCGRDGRRPRRVVRPVPRTRTTAPEAIISSDKTLSWDYCEDFRPEDEVLLRARERTAQYGCAAVTPGVGAVLQLLAASVQARTAVEVGTGTGVASLWILRGMAPDGRARRD